MGVAGPADSPPVTTRSFIPKSELLGWLRGSVRRRESVVLKVIADAHKEVITLRLSEGKLIHADCEGCTPLEALLLLSECKRVRFGYSSVRMSERRELMSAEGFQKWLDSAGESVEGALDAETGASSRASEEGRWSGTLRGAPARKGKAPLVAAVVATAVLVVAFGLYLSTGFEAGDSVETRTSAASPEAPAKLDDPRAAVVSPSIVESTTWKAGRSYRLDGLVFVESGARLAIEPGVTVLGGPGSALVVTRDGSLHARGTAAEPIVFTSAMAEGKRASGDWGGVVLLGSAPTNRGEADIEGISPGDSRSAFGGDDPGSNCGLIEFARVEFAGYQLGQGNGLNGLTLGGCGSETIIRHVQVHRAHDDGVEIFGGTVDLKYVIVSQARDDAFDWDMGWTGRAQFLVVQQHPDVGDAGFEGENSEDEPEAKPVSRPRIYNATLVGSRSPNRNQRAMVVRHGSGGEFRNLLIAGFPREAIDLRGDLTTSRIASRTLSFGSIAMYLIGADGQTFFREESGENDDDGGFDERDYFSWVAPDIVLDAPPALGPKAWHLTQPDFAPVAAYIGAGSVWRPPESDEFWEESANYYGAVRYGEKRNWTLGWTAYPEN